MVAPIYKNQSLQLSPSFSVKDVVESHTKENRPNNNTNNKPATMPFLEMECESSSSDAVTSTVHEYLDTSMPSSSIRNPNQKSQNKSVTFSQEVHVHEIPLLTQEQKNDMFFNKLDKRNTKIELKRLVAFYRAGRNNFFFDASAQDEEIIQIPLQERTKIGLEAHINPHMKISIRRRMTKLVLQHQDWSRQHPSFFDDQFLGQNCETVSKSATLLALERAKTVIRELKQEQQQEGPMRNIRVNMSNQEPDDYLSSLCTDETMLDVTTSTTTAAPTEFPSAMETDEEPKEARMEAPGQACMVR